MGDSEFRTGGVARPSQVNRLAAVISTVQSSVAESVAARGVIDTDRVTCPRNAKLSSINTAPPPLIELRTRTANWASSINIQTYSKFLIIKVKNVVRI
jgi:hypothetical protein